VASAYWRVDVGVLQAATDYAPDVAPLVLPLRNGHGESSTMSKHTSAFPMFWRGSEFVGLIALSSVLYGALELGRSAIASGDPLPTKWAWTNVAIEGGGWVTGIDLSPTTRNGALIRTDVGGAFRWDELGMRWIGVAASVDPEETFRQQVDCFTSIPGIAFDPADSRTLYLSAGAYVTEWGRPGRLYKSTDGGVTLFDITPTRWGETSPPVRLAGNDGDPRFTGETITVNPLIPRHVFVATPRNGLWKSTDGGTPMSWVQTSLPVGENKKGMGVTSLSFSPTGSGRLFAAVYGLGVYRSDDGAATWTIIESSPKGVMRLVAESDNAVWVAAEDGLWRWSDGNWKNFASKTEPGRFTALTVDPRNPKRVIAASGVATKWKERFYRTQDGGETWEKAEWRVERSKPSWMPERAIEVAPTDLAFDPFVENRVWLAHGFGVSRTDDVFASTIRWVDLNQGIEQTCVFELAAPKGVPLMSSIADLSGFLHDHGVEQAPVIRLMDRPFHERYMDSCGFAWSKQLSPAGYPSVIYRGVFGRDWKIKQEGKDHRLRALMKSTDGGATWGKVNEWFLNGGDKNNGYPLRLEVSAGNGQHLFAAFDGYYAFSRDGGEKWAPSSGTPGALGGPWLFTAPISSDQLEPDTFYIYNSGRVFISRDGGKSFTPSSSTLPKMSPMKDFVKVAGDPNKAGRVWVGLCSRFDRRTSDDSGLFVSDDFGSTFSRSPGVDDVIGFDFGAPEFPEKPHPLYLYGRVNGQKGMWERLNGTSNWHRIDDPSFSLAKARNITASQDEYGLVFLGTNGNGIFMGKKAGVEKGLAWKNAPKLPGQTVFNDRKEPGTIP